MKLLPVALDVRERRCLIVGGGPVAARKAHSLLECEARVTLIAPEICRALEPLLHRLEYSARRFQAGDCAGFELIFACVDNREVNAAVAAAAKEAGAWCNIVDDAAASDFHAAAAMRRGDVCIGITTGGGSPALARHLKKQVEECVGPEYEELLALMKSRRDTLKSEVDEQDRRALVWRSVLESEVLVLLKDKRRAEAEQLVDELIGQNSRLMNNGPVSTND